MDMPKNTQVGIVHVFHTGWSWAKETTEIPTVEILQKWLGGPITILESIMINGMESQLVILTNPNTNPDSNFINIVATTTLKQPIKGKAAIIQGFKV